MKLTQRLFLFFFITLFSTSVSVYLLSKQIFLEGFSGIEDEIAETNLQRISQIISEEQSNLHLTALTWSYWDETYNFMRTRSQTYLQRSLEVPAAFKAEFGQVLIANMQGEIVYSGKFDWKSEKFSAIESEQVNLIKRDILPLVKRGGSLQQGLFVGADQVPYLISTSPILNSKAEGPARGYFIVLREINQDLKQKFSKILRMKMDISVGNSNIDSDRENISTRIFKAQSVIHGEIELPDILKSNRLIAKLEIPRTIYNQGIKTIFSFMVIIGFFLTFTFGLIFFGFHKDVLSKILKLKTSLNEVGNQTNQVHRIPWQGRDEIAELTQNINAMLERLENSQLMVSRASKFSALGEMAGSIAHEINNPLAIITGFCTRLIRAADKEKLEKEEIKEIADRILKTSYRIERIIKSLRLVSRDGEQDQKTMVALGDILDEVISLSDNKLQEFSIELRLNDFDRDEKVQVRFVQIVQVLLNLLTNSIDAVQPMNERWIEFRTEADEKLIHIFVIDSGHGISPSIAEKIMDPFFTTKELGRGTGLGLSISKGIIEGHGGSFQLVKSSPQTTFKISLPR